MRDVPGLICAVAAKTATDLVVDAALGHFPQSVSYELQRFAVGFGKIMPQAEFQFHRVKELWGIAKSAIHGIESALQVGKRELRRFGGKHWLDRAFGWQHLGERFQQRQALPLDFLPPYVISLGHLRQQVEKARQTVAPCLWEVNPAKERLLLGSQKQGQRPAARALGEH